MGLLRKSLLGQAGVVWSRTLGTPCYTYFLSKSCGSKYLQPAACWLLLLNFLQTFPPLHTYTTYYGLHQVPTSTSDGVCPSNPDCVYVPTLPNQLHG